jgi:O-acetyl-ADP-ribose deacetylase (regulator of RNase III)
MKTSLGRTAIEIAAGDITALDVDAIVSAADSTLRMAAGVSCAIKRAAGQEVEDDAVRQGPIGVGDVVVTAGHGLKARWVVHAAIMAPQLPATAEAIAGATYSALERADSQKARSIALPPFGTGVGRFPLYQSTAIMVAEITRFLQAHPKTRLRLIVLCGDDAAGVAAFTHALTGMDHF